MPRETIASVKRAGATRLREAKGEHEAAIDRLVAVHRAAETELRRQLADKNQALDALRAELAGCRGRIDELFNSNNAYQAEARAARADVGRVQAALSAASRVIAALGQRPE